MLSKEEEERERARARIYYEERMRVSAKVGIKTFILVFCVLGIIAVLWFFAMFYGI
jgi:type IV secretory pathway component VirB8